MKSYLISLLIVSGLLGAVFLLLSDNWNFNFSEIKIPQGYDVTNGKITKLEVEPKFDPHKYHAGKKVPVQYWTVNVVYEYTVGEKTHKGRKFALNGNPTALTEESIYKKVMKVSDGGLVKVYYEKQNPKNSVLYPSNM